MSARENRVPSVVRFRLRPADRDASRPIAIFAAASLTIVLFALTATTTRIVVMQISGFDAGLVRAVGAGLFAMALIAVCRIRPPHGIADWGLLLVSALGSFVAFPLLFSLGAERTSASHAGLLMGLLPLVTSGIGMAIERRLRAAAWFAGASIALCGVAALVLLRSQAGQPAATIGGDLLVAAALVLCSAGFVAGARLANRISAWAATFWGVAVARPLAGGRGLLRRRRVETSWPLCAGSGPCRAAGSLGLRCCSSSSRRSRCCSRSRCSGSA